MKSKKNNHNIQPSDDVPSWPFFIKGRTDVIMIHIPKTAGTSIRWSLNFNHVDQTKHMRKHYKAKDIIDLIGQTRWNNAFKFAFVRNPWDRLLSFYYFRLRKNRIPDERLKASFKDWAFSELAEKDSSLSPPFNLENQLDWLKDQQDKVNIDFIGRFENLQRDFQVVKDRLSLNVDLMHLNKNHLALDYRRHYDPELTSLIADYYCNDINHFGYTF